MKPYDVKEKKYLSTAGGMIQRYDVEIRTNLEGWTGFFLFRYQFLSANSEKFFCIGCRLVGYFFIADSLKFRKLFSH